MNRCFAFIGPHLPLDADFAAGNFIRDVIAGGPIVVKGDGKSVRSHLYALDLAVWLWTILFKGLANSIYNVGSDRGITISELAGSLDEMTNVAVARHGQEAYEDKMATHYVPATSLAKSELGLEERISLRDGLLLTFRWH